MKIFDDQCSNCGAMYHVAESETLPPTANYIRCSVCASEIVGGRMLRPKVMKLVLPPDQQYSAIQRRGLKRSRPALST
jgi:DNA-directed RNA polymerase subunit RPC12/RpoP